MRVLVTGGVRPGKSRHADEVTATVDGLLDHVVALLDDRDEVHLVVAGRVPRL